MLIIIPSNVVLGSARAPDGALPIRIKSSKKQTQGQSPSQQKAWCFYLTEGVTPAHQLSTPWTEKGCQEQFCLHKEQQGDGSRCVLSSSTSTCGFLPLAECDLVTSLSSQPAWVLTV